MKQFLVIALLFPIISAAQKRDSLPIKNANRIVIVTNKPAADNYKFLGIALDNAGYTVDLQDDSLFTIQTAEIRGNSVSVTYHLNGIAKDNEILLFGKYTSNVEATIGGTGTKRFTYDISNTGKKGSASQFTFSALDEVARMFNVPRYYIVEETQRTSIIK
jgi:hypothetical protein